MRFVLMMLMLCGSAIAQEPLTVAVRVESSAEFSAPPRLVGNRVFYAKGTKLNDGDMGFVVVKGDAEAVVVDAVRFKLVGNEVVVESAEVTQIGRKEFAITGLGKYSVQVTGFVLTKDAQGESFLTPKKLKAFPITLGAEPEPDKPDNPEPIPNPNVPADGFDNIGQRIAQWSVGLPKRVEVGAVYAKYARQLATDQSFQIVQAFNSASADRVALLGADLPAYNDIVQKINADVEKRWPMGKGVVIDYFRAIARGYGAKVE